MSDCSHCGAPLPEAGLFCATCGAPAFTADPDELLASSASDPTGLLDRLRAVTEGEFVIIRELGRGGMGRVYLAHEIALERRVALKVLPPELTEHAEIVQRFQREARTAGKLAHPHIVHVYQVMESGGFHFFTMPYIAGPNLRHVLKRTPQLDVEPCLRYLCESADALAFAHGRGVVHRDIKPENMLLEGSQDGRLLLTDFGIAKPLESVSTITRPGDRMGTPYYMSPEQCEEREGIDGRSDQYSLGLVAYEMLAGRFPFTAESLAAMVYKHVHEYPEPLETLRPDVPAALRSVIERAYRKDRAERYPTMGAMLEALRAVKKGEGAPRPVGPLERSSRRWRKPASIAGMLVAVLAIGAVGLTLWQSRVRIDRSASVDRESAETPAEPGATTAGFDVAPGGEDDVVAGPAMAGGEARLAATDSGDPSNPEVSGGQPPGTGTELREARRQADQTRLEAESARQSALEQGADTLFASAFAALDDRLAAAVTALADGQVVAAAIGFAAVRSGYLDLSARRAEGPADLEREGGNQSEVAEGDDSLAAGSAIPPGVSVEEPSSATTPEDAIRSLVNVYGD
ncbi:MAG: serine/threonine-protein kinase, partial [Gemmatimonadales bacterium]